MDNLRKGTPKTLVEAIQNGLESFHAQFPANGPAAKEIVKGHVRDFLAQHFSSAMMSAKSEEESAKLERLFKTLVGEARAPEIDPRAKLRARLLRVAKDA